MKAGAFGVLLFVCGVGALAGVDALSQARDTRRAPTWLGVLQGFAAGAVCGGVALVAYAAFRWA